MELVLIIVLILLLIGAIPAYSWNRDWGYGPASLIVFILLLWLILALLGAI